MKKNKILNFYWFNFFKSPGYIYSGGDNVVPSSWGSAGMSQVLLSYWHVVHGDNIRGDGEPSTLVPGGQWDWPALQVRENFSFIGQFLFFLLFAKQLKIQL